MACSYEDDVDVNSFLFGSILGISVSIMTAALYGRRRPRRSKRRRSPQTFNLVPLGARYNHESDYEAQNQQLSANDQLKLALQRTEGEQCLYSSFLMGAYDKDRMEWQTVCWLDYGFTHAARMNASKDLTVRSARVSGPRDDYNTCCTPTPAVAGMTTTNDSGNSSTTTNYQHNQCDVWFEPQHVWSVTAECAYETCQSTCAYGKTGDPEKGICLRFPRFRARLEDDSVELAAGDEGEVKLKSCSSDELLRAFQRQ